MRHSIRYDYLVEATALIRNDQKSWGLTERELSKIIGVSHSTLNSFLNAKYAKPQRRTLVKILEAKIWSERTRMVLEALLNFEKTISTRLVENGMINE